MIQQLSPTPQERRIKCQYRVNAWGIAVNSMLGWINTEYIERHDISSFHVSFQKLSCFASFFPAFLEEDLDLNEMETIVSNLYRSV